MEACAHLPALPAVRVQLRAPCAPAYDMVRSPALHLTPAPWAPPYNQDPRSHACKVSPAAPVALREARARIQKSAQRTGGTVAGSEHERRAAQRVLGRTNKRQGRRSGKNAQVG